MGINKLIRDNLPKLLEAKGKECKVKELDLEEYAEKLGEKLEEEFSKFMLEYKAENDEQAILTLADMMEVIFGIVDFIGVDLGDFEKIRLKKLEKDGGYKKRLLLEQITNSN